MFQRPFVAASLAASLTILVVASAAAQSGAASWPTKPIRLVVGFPAGGPTDVVARTIAQRLGDLLGQTIVVDNRPGAAGNLGAELVVKSAPDGYTMLLGTVATTIAPAIYKDLRYHVQRDLAPVSLVAATPFVVAVNPALPAGNIKDFIALLKAQPGKHTCSSSGNGSPIHLACEIFKSMAGVQLTHVPYSGSVPALAAVAGGHVSVMFETINTAMPMIRGNRVKGLAVAAKQRFAGAPEMPTVDESGVPGYEANTWSGLFVPVQTPKAVITRIHEATVAALKTPEVGQRLAQSGAEPVGNTPEQFAAIIRADLAKWAKAVKESGAKID